MNLLIWIIFGIAVGWAASRLMKGYSQGLLMDLILGVIGSVVGGWLFDFLGISVRGGAYSVGSFVTAVIGAMLVLFIVGTIRRSR